MNPRSMSDLKDRYREILKDLEAVCGADVKDMGQDLQLGQFNMEKMMDRTEMVAKIHYDLLVLRNDLRSRIDKAHYSGEDKRFKNEAFAFLAEMKQDARTVSDMSNLWAENMRAARQIFGRLHSHS